MTLCLVSADLGKRDDAAADDPRVRHGVNELIDCIREVPGSGETWGQESSKTEKTVSLTHGKEGILYCRNTKDIIKAAFCRWL